jgi:hypothetical protein
LGTFAGPRLCLTRFGRCCVAQMVMLESNTTKHGALTLNEVHTLVGKVVGRMQANGLAEELADLGYKLPTTEVLMHALFKRDLVEWHSIQAFQDVTMRLIAMGVVSVCEEHEPEQDVTSAASKLDQPSTLPPSSPSSRLRMLLQRSLSPSQRSLSPRSPDLLQKKVAHQSKEMYLRLELLRHVPTLPAPRGKFEYHMVRDRRSNSGRE